MPFIPLLNRYLVRVIESDKVSPGGILLAPSSAPDIWEGEIVAVGTGRVTDAGAIQALELGAGTRVLFPKHSGIEVTIDGEKRKLLAEEEILGYFA